MDSPFDQVGLYEENSKRAQAARGSTKDRCAEEMTGSPGLPGRVMNLKAAWLVMRAEEGRWELARIQPGE
jgi:hypothetical protein